MEKHDEEMERYLAAFQPRPILPLPASRRLGHTRAWRLAAAAVLFVCVSVPGWYALRGSRRSATSPTVPQISQEQRIGAVSPRRPAANSLALTKFVLEHPDQLDEALAGATLPDFRAPNSALGVLAKE